MVIRGRETVIFERCEMYGRRVSCIKQSKPLGGQLQLIINDIISK